MIQSIKNTLLDVSAFRHLWGDMRAAQYEKRYRLWQQHYCRLAEVKGLRYSPEATRQAVRTQLRHRIPASRELGEVHSLIMTLTSNWALGMVYELEELGPVSVFDWEQFGFCESDPQLPSRLPELNTRMLEFVRETHKLRPVDWVLICASGKLILGGTLRAIHEELGIPTVNQWLDCKQNFEGGPGPHGQDTGQKDIASEFDLVWTSSRSMCEPYLAVGARPLYLPEGFSPRFTPKVECPKRFEVGFMGAHYGLRPDYLNALRRSGIEVEARGPGWGTSVVPLDQMGQFFGECKINLGIGGIGYSTQLTTLKGRDFEVPGAGGIYLTTFNPDLADFFDIGREILCYHSVEDMIDLAHRVLRDDALGAGIASRAYARSMHEHRWVHRFQTILVLLEVLKVSEQA